MKIRPVILCGGSATRLWPVSRACLPKPFVPLVDGRTTFEMTLERIADDKLFLSPLIIANQQHRFLIGEAVEKLGTKAQIVLEPEPRDSAAAIAVAAILANEEDPDTMLLVLASDHVVNNLAEFRKTVKEAAKISALGHITTFGIEPHEPSSEFGYIQMDENQPIDKNGYSVKQFVEKPDKKLAEKYLANGFLWNSGNFMFSAKTMLTEMQTHCPKLLDVAGKSVANAKIDLDFLRLDETSFSQCPKLSIDYAVMEKTNVTAVVRAGFDWSDVGTWESIWDLSKKDKQGNASNQEAYIMGSKNCYVHGDGRLMALIGCENLIVVSTKDALLVVDRNNVSQVKQLVEQLRSDERIEVVENLRMYRPWGDYETLDLGSRHQVKRISVKPGGKLSLQKHFHRAEHWIVVKGTANVTRGSETFLVYENENVYLPMGCEHRLENPGKISLELIEVQTGAYLGEDDIIRIDDEFGRT
ncbi:mannose-1-phosphate guanylyltransferase/mannose-6-phosphate isomerase [Sneathiella marina]|uniref:mannose-1-phosphate guanylyltransferase n=1 Tax=Sneathiella marina TaxID=2950108 RepID=A0ABY4W3A9_9PROT|nr:mannose-1-phosphate guanylyltransferase/mannose-6-phosphate isomerase [Sneathiella marina]USG61306.1 mannose-1-phosphate guanylyltransferase/mannose-6-phosphate isomerase [Sneathiella marina]